jgi:fatty-acyl-CoA synthase
MKGEEMLNNNPSNGLSHVVGDTSELLSEQTIPELLARTASTFPEREAVVFPTQDIRWPVAYSALI